MTQQMLVQEAKDTGISVRDLRQRRIWLGELGHKGFWTADLAQFNALHPAKGKPSDRSRRARSIHVKTCN